MSYIAELQGEDGFTQEIYSISIGFDRDEKSGKISTAYIWAGKMRAYSTTIPLVTITDEYIDVKLESGTNGCVIVGESEERLFIDFNQRFRAIEVVCEGGARIVKLA